MNAAQQLIQSGEISPPTQLEEQQILGEIDDQQLHAKKFGGCTFGCSHEQIVMGWPFAFDPKIKFEHSGIQPVCQWTRMPCRQLQMATIYEFYQGINRK